MTFKFNTLIYCMLLLSSLFLQSTVIADDKEENGVAMTMEELRPATAGPGARPSNSKNTSESQTTETSWWSTQNAMTISVVVLVFGLLFIFMLARMVKKEDSTTEELMKLFLIPLIIIMGVFLVVAGYSDTQITPVMTLLGTIIGFLFGTKPKPSPEEESPSPTKPLESNGGK